jgi:phytoene synthase
MTPDDYCEAKTGGKGTSLHYSLMFAPPAPRRAVTAVYAFMREVGEIADECHDPGVAQTKFTWWVEEIARLYDGKPRHPVAQALAPAVSAHGIEQRQFLTVIQETAAAFAHGGYGDFDTLKGHCQRTGGTAMGMAAAILGITDIATHRYAEMLGTALELTDILSNLGQDLRRERLSLPLDDLQRFGVGDNDLFALRQTPAFEQLMQFETQRNLEQYDQALRQLPKADRAAQLPGVILANIARAQLGELKRDGFHVLERRVALTPLRKFWIAWRTRLAVA